MAILPAWIRGSRLQPLLIALPVAGLAVLCLFQIAGPAYRSDEVAYLAHAAAIAGKQNGLGGSWYAGYSLLLSPFFRLAPRVLEAWPAVIAVNALAVVTSLLLLGRALKRSGAADRQRAFRLVLLSMLVLAATAYIGWAFTNCLLMALIGGVVLLLAGPDLLPRHAVGAGLLLGYATWVHPTGLLLLVAATLACLRPGPGPLRWRPSLLILTIGLGMAFAYLRMVHPAIAALHGGAEGHYDAQIGSLLSQLGEEPLATLSTLAVGMVNGLATSAIASFGYVGAALVAILPTTRPSATSRPLGNGLRRVLLFLLIGWGLLVSFSAALLPHAPTDVQLAFHQRYTQPVLPGLVLFGMALAPRRWTDRLLAWLLSALPIVLALGAAFWRPYDTNFSVVDQLPAVTFFLDRDSVPLMLMAGLATTGAVQLLGWRAFLPLAGGFLLLGWLQMLRLQRAILQGDSRPPAMAAAAAAVGRAGLHPCVDLTETPGTPGELDRLMRYYLAGADVTFVGRAQASPRPCAVRIRPVSAQPDRPAPTPTARPVSTLSASAACRPLLADTHAMQVLEDCREPGTAPGLAIEPLLLPARRDLVSLTRIQQLQPVGYGVVNLIQGDGLPPQAPRDGDWWRMVPTPMPIQTARPGRSLLYGPYLSLPAGRYRVVYDGLAIASGSLRMAITSDSGRQELMARELGPGDATGVIAFSLDRPRQDVEVILRALTPAEVRRPSSLVVFSTPPPRSATWSVHR